MRAHDTDWRRAAALFLLAAIPRLAYLLILRPEFDGAYWVLSDSLIHTGSIAVDGVRNTDYDPLYPAFLAALRVIARHHVAIVQALQALVASAGAPLADRLARSLTGSTRIGALAALCYAFDLLLIRQSVAEGPLMLVTVLVVAWAAWFVDAETPADAVKVAAALALAVLARATALPLVALSAILLIAGPRHAHESRAPHARLAMLSTAVIAAVILPFSWRSFSLNGSWWPTRSGINLFIGNSPYTSQLLPAYDLDLLQPLAGAETNDALTRRALDYMKADPRRTLREKAVNVVYAFWPPLVPRTIALAQTDVVIKPSGEISVVNPVERPALEVLPYSVWYAAVLVAAMAGVTIRRKELRRDAALWSVLATFTAAQVVVFPATRYRAPMEFVLLFYAAVAVDRLLARPTRRAT